MTARPPRVSALRLLPVLWLAAMVALPAVIVAKISLSESVVAQPPYTPRFAWSDGPAGWLEAARTFSFDNYRQLALDPGYAEAALNSATIAAAATALLLLVGYPMALAISRTGGAVRTVLLALVTVPFWTSFLVRIYAWIAILRTDGILDDVLLSTGLIDRPLAILNTNAAVLIGLVYAYLPFAVLPIFASLARAPDDLVEAAADLGATPLVAFWTVTWPLSRPGVVAAILVTALPIFGEAVVPDLLGGPGTPMIGRTLWVEFFSNRDWPLASALALVTVVALIGPALLLRRRAEAVPVR